jgi:transcription elongation factor Elf1
MTTKWNPSLRPIHLIPNKYQSQREILEVVLVSCREHIQLLYTVDRVQQVDYFHQFLDMYLEMHYVRNRMDNSKSFDESQHDYDINTVT